MSEFSRPYRFAVGLALALVLLSAGHMLLPHGHADEAAGTPCLVCAAVSWLVVAGLLLPSAPKVLSDALSRRADCNIPRRRVVSEPSALRAPPLRLSA